MVILDLKNIMENLGDKFTCNGVCLIQSYTKQPTKNGGSFMGGTLSTAEGSIMFKSWSNSSAYSDLVETNLSGCIAYIHAEVNIYNGSKSLIVTNVRPISEEACTEAGIKVSDLLYSKYNTDAYWDTFVNLVKSKVSENAFKVFELVMQGNEEAFKTEFAAASHHDNCKGGLLAHSLKACQIASIVRIYPSIANKIGNDLLYVACAIHDIGKVVEYNLGSVSDKGIKVSHPIIGCLMIQNHKDDIVNLMGESFYDDLLSVISGHHGEYGEPPRTVAAYIIHKIDLVDSIFTSVNELLEVGNEDRIVYDGFKLS